MNDTITLNPSLLSFQPISSFSGTFNWVPSATTNRVFNASVIDGKNQYVNAGLSFTRKPDLDFIHAAVAKRVLPWLGLGASAKRFTTRSNTLSASGGAISGIDGGVSASIVLPPDLVPVPLQFGFTADNLRGRAEDELHQGPRQYGFGFKANLRDILLLYGDAVENVSRFTGAFPLYSAGAEIALGGSVYARGGMLGFRQRGWSLGGGWVGPKVGVAYGYQNIRQNADRGFQHAITMDIFM